MFPQDVHLRNTNEGIFLIMKLKGDLCPSFPVYITTNWMLQKVHKQIIKLIFSISIFSEET